MLRLCGMALAGLLVVVSAGNRSAGDSGTGPELVLTVAVSQNNFVVGEPVVVDMKLSNMGASEVYVLNELTVNAGIVRIEIEDPSGKSRRYVPKDKRDPASRTNLRPGEAIGAIQDVSFLRQRWPGGELMLPTPGRYRVTVHYDGFLPEGVARPQPQTVEFTVSEAEQGRAAEVFRDPMVMRLLADEEPILEASEKLRGLQRGGSNGIFEPYVHYYLGTDCLARYEESGQAAPAGRQDELKRCAGLLTRASVHVFQLKDMALLGLARAETAMNNLVTARKHAKMSMDTSPRLFVQKQAAKLLEQIGQREHGKTR